MTRDELETVMAEADCLASAQAVDSAIAAMAEKITGDMRTTMPVVLCVVKGGIVFAGQLLTRLSFPLDFDYIHATRYGNGTQGDRLRWQVEPSVPLADRHVLVLDDILDVGATLEEIVRWCRQQGAVDVRTAVLVDKRHARKVRPGLRADYTGLDIPDRYVFGYGMDYQGYWRNAPGIFAVRGL